MSGFRSHKIKFKRDKQEEPLINTKWQIFDLSLPTSERRVVGSSSVTSRVGKTREKVN